MLDIINYVKDVPIKQIKALTSLYAGFDCVSENIIRPTCGKKTKNMTTCRNKKGSYLTAETKSKVLWKTLFCSGMSKISSHNSALNNDQVSSNISIKIAFSRAYIISRTKTA